MFCPMKIFQSFALALACVAGVALAQSYPTKPVRLVVSFPPGAGTDTIARLVGRDLQDILGQPVVVENKPGAAGNIAAELVAKAPPDGHTLLVVNSTFAANVGLFPKLPFDPVKDFVPVALLGSAPLLIAASPSSGIDSLRTLVRRARAQPGTLSYASCGNGGPPHIIGEQFMKSQGLKVTHVPYKGCGPATTDVVSGHVPVLFTNFSSTVPFLSSGRLKALAVTLKKRSPLAPDVPTVAELGLGNLDADLWFGLVAPAGTPKDIVERLNGTINQVMARPEIQEKFRAQVIDPQTMSTAEFAAYLNSEIDRYSALIRQFGIKVD
jgi:tripartite-type tricarboxylate transporter receptor subunit TctC